MWPVWHVFNISTVLVRSVRDLESPNKLRHTVDLGAWLMAPANDGTGRSAIVAQRVAHLSCILFIYLFSYRWLRA